jgi:hypothetical protein
MFPPVDGGLPRKDAGRGFKTLGHSLKLLGYSLKTPGRSFKTLKRSLTTLSRPDIRRRGRRRSITTFTNNRSLFHGSRREFTGVKRPFSNPQGAKLSGRAKRFIQKPEYHAQQGLSRMRGNITFPQTAALPVPGPGQPGPRSLL